MNIYFEQIINGSRNISLGSGHMRGEVILELCEALESNNSITYLDLSRNDITDTHGVVLANVLQSQSHLVRLDLGRNDIGINTITQICENISKYCLHNNGIGDDGAVLIAKSLKSTKVLQRINLFGNRIGDKGATAFPAALRHNQSLTHLDLGANAISAEGSRHFTELLYSVDTVSLVWLAGVDLASNAEMLFLNLPSGCRKMSNEQILALFCRIRNSSSL